MLILYFKRADGQERRADRRESGSSIDWWEWERSREIDDQNVSSYRLTTTTVLLVLRFRLYCYSWYVVTAF